MELFDFLSYPFMQRAVIAGIFLGAILASLGIFVTLRRMAFFGEGIAHASLAGIAIGIFSGLSPLPVALGFSLMIAIGIFFLERHTNISTDAAIGIFFTFAMALGVVIMNVIPGYQPELVSFLFGSILAISTPDLWLIGTCSLAILTWLFFSRKQLTFLSLSEEQATVAGVPVRIQTALFYGALAIATVLGVKMLGIILISSLLILPPSLSQLFARSSFSHVVISIAIAQAIIFFGLAVSYVLDLPSGATIVLLGTTIFFLLNAMKKFLKKSL